MRQHAPPMAQGMDAPDGARPAEFLSPQFKETLFGAAMGNQNRGIGQSVSAMANGSADFEIVRETVPKSKKSADFLQSSAPERDSGTEAGMCDSGGCPEHGVWQ